MNRLGQPYQELVGEVQKALDPGAVVNVGRWVNGPDGRRDMDVEVRGTVNGNPYFTLVECKDWNNPVGIEVVDALESKRRDLDANLAVIFSNSGFTIPALAKARRVGIETASALRAGDSRIRVRLESFQVARACAIDRWYSTLYVLPGMDLEIENDWKFDELLYDGIPARNWVSELSNRLLRENQEAKEIRYRCVVRPGDEWSLGGIRQPVAGLELVFECSSKWLGQKTYPDVTLGLYNHSHNRVVVPNQQAMITGFIDQSAWEEVDSERAENENAVLMLKITLLKPIPPIGDKSIPPIDAAIVESEVKATM